MIRTVFFITMIFLLSAANSLYAQPRVTVAKDGSGNFKTIQEAVNSLPEFSENERIIYIKNGIYKEQLYVGKQHVVLQGENRERTIITSAVASLIYSCNNPESKYSGIVNLDGDDITIMNLTIENSYGKNAPDSVFIDCINRTTKQSEKIKVVKSAHQFALRSFKSTRLKVINCIIRAWGADTVSPWNHETGMYYFKDCVMQGGTDFYCPRGWAYAENCTFISINPSAAVIWHDGSKDRDMKSVMKGCNFIGATPYILGRYHHEANFYLINCSFDKNLADLPIYRAATAKPMFWDSHAYYYNCHAIGNNFGWLKNNLETAPGNPAPEAITAQWTFGGKWDPETKK